MNNIIVFKEYALGEKGAVCMCKILKDIQGKTATELLDIYTTDKSIPIDIYRLLDEIGIKIKSIDFSDVEEKIGYKRGDILGATLIDGEEVEIFYRAGVSENRKKFTIAHELAHCCCHSELLKNTHIQLRKESECEKLKEKEANVFAGELLIPEERLKEYYGKLILPSLSVLAEIFSVSTSVMGARLDYLNLSYFKDVGLDEG